MSRLPVRFGQEVVDVFPTGDIAHHLVVEGEDAVALSCDVLAEIRASGALISTLTVAGAGPVVLRTYLKCVSPVAVAALLTRLHELATVGAARIERTVVQLPPDHP